MKRRASRDPETASGAEESDSTEGASRRAGVDGQVNRREVLKAGAVGVAASITAGSVARGATPKGSAHSGGQEPQTEPPATGPPAAQPPRIEDIVDPTQSPVSTWQEPWVWRPSDWPGQALDLNVVANANLTPSPSPGNPYGTIFSFGGNSPAPTIRMRGDEQLRIKLRNLLGLDHGKTAIGPAPDPFDLTRDLDREICRLARARGRRL